MTTLYCRALESASETPILVDPAAEELIAKLDPLLAPSRSALHRQLLERRIDRRDAAFVALRAARFDRCALEFASRTRPSLIVNLGCGFDTRFQRIDDGELQFLDVDRAEIIRLKRHLSASGNRHRHIQASVLETDWMSEIAPTSSPPLFLAEGLLMYLPEDRVRALVLEIQARFPGAEFVTDVIDTRWLRPWIRWTIDVKLRWRYRFGKSARFVSGLRNSRDMENWGEGIEYLREWCILDESEPKSGLSRVLRRLEIARRLHRVVHYRLHPV